jgi:hypothetical protein
VGKQAGESRERDKRAGKGRRGKGKQDRAGLGGAPRRLEELREPAARERASGRAGEAGGDGVGAGIPAVAPASVLASMPEVWLASVLVPRESFARLVAQAGELPDALRALGDAETRAVAAEAELRTARVRLALLERQLALARGDPAPGGGPAGRGLRRWLGRRFGTARVGSERVQRSAGDGAGEADQLVGGG